MPEQTLENISPANIAQFRRALARTAISPSSQQRVIDKLLTPELINSYLFRNLEQVESELHLVTLILTIIISDERENAESVPKLFGYLHLQH